MKKIDLKLCFKGSRGYLQGTDMYTTICSDLGFTACDIRMSFHKIVKTSLTAIHLSNGNAQEISNVAASFTCSDESGHAHRIFLVENGNRVDCRYEYEEEKVYAQCTINENVIALNCCGLENYSNIEMVVAANKRMHETCLDYPDIKWLFAKIAVKSDINTLSPKTIGISLDHDMGGKLTKSRIFFDSAEIGEMYYSGVKKGSV